MAEPEFISYYRNVDTRPAFGMIREDLPELKKRLPHLFFISLPYEAIDNGLPTPGEHKRVTKLEDKLAAAFKPRCEYIGHVLGEGRSIVIFVSKETEPASRSIKTSLFKEESFQLETASWAWFQAGIGPSEEEIILSSSLELYQELAAHGDNHSATRPVDFTSWFRSEEMCIHFMAEVESKGFRLGKDGHWEPLIGEFYCEYTLDTPIEQSVLAPILIELHELSERFNGEFDGWACPVTK